MEQEGGSTATLQRLGQFTASPTANFTDPFTVRKLGTLTEWDAPFYTTTGIVGPWYTTFQPQNTTSQSIIGIVNSIRDPILFNTIEYGIFLSAGNAQVYQSGRPVASLGPYKSTDIFTIQYDGINVSYLQNGLVEFVTSNTDSAAATFYMAGVIYTPGATITRLFFKQNPYVSNMLTSQISPAITISSITYTTFRESIISYPPGVYCCGIPTTTNLVAFGLSTTMFIPNTAFNTSMIKYGYIVGTTTIRVIVNSSVINISYTGVATDTFRIIYDGREVKWLKGNRLIYIIRDSSTYSSAPCRLVAGFTAGSTLGSMRLGEFQVTPALRGPPRATPINASYGPIYYSVPLPPTLPMPVPFVEGNAYYNPGLPNYKGPTGP